VAASSFCRLALATKGPGISGPLTHGTHERILVAAGEATTFSLAELLGRRWRIGKALVVRLTSSPAGEDSARLVTSATAR